MKFSLRLLLTSSVLLANQAWARPDPAFEISQTAFSYTESTETAKTDGGDPTETTHKAFESMPSDLELSMKAGKWIFAVTPTEPGAALEVTYEESSRFGYGLGIGYNHTTDDTEDLKADTTSFEFGPHANYDFDFGDNTVAFEARVAMTSAKGSAKGVDEAQKPVDTKTDEAGFEVEFVVNYERMLTDNFAVSTGIGYTYGNSKEKEEGVKTTTGELALTLLQVHYGIYN